MADEEVRIQTPLGVIAVQWEHDADGYASVSVLRIADSETECAASWDAHIQLPDSPPVSGGEERKEVYDYICRREGLKPLKHGGWRYGDKRQQGGK